METLTGTSDLGWCDRVIKEKFFEKAGWPEYQKKKYPFLVDTSMFIMHIAENGTQYPIKVPDEFMPEPKKKKKDDRMIEKNVAASL